jgi:hypothetical protein
MKIEDILKLTDTAEIYKHLAVINPKIKVAYKDCKKQFDPLLHDVFDLIKRPKKEVQKPTGNKLPGGETEYALSLEDVARLAVPFQKIIVSRVASFLLNNGIIRHNDVEQSDVQTPEMKVIELIDKIWKDCKLDYRTKELARLTMSECEAAEVWYFEKQENLWTKFLGLIGITSVKLRPRMKIWANSLGDSLYPHFNETGDMDAFLRQYSIIVDTIEIKKLEIYTADRIIFYTLVGGDWVMEKNEKNLIGKIPVIYYWQPYPEWHDVQKLIDRFETMISNFADTNDYFGSPMVVANGDIEGFADKGESGKFIQVKGEHASVDYLTWDQAPESIKLEIDTLQGLIYSMTQTPNISFDNLKSIGTVSGIALKLMFLDMHLKCFLKQEIFGEMIQRRLNLLKAIVGKVIAVKFSNEADSVELWPEFVPYLPSADNELVSTLSTAAGGKPIMSQRTAVKNNPFVDDVDQEMQQIESESVADISQPAI